MFLGASAGFAIDASAMQSKVEDAAGKGDPYTPELQDAYSRGQRDQTLAIVAGVAGVAAVGAGVVLFVMDRGGGAGREQARPAALLPVVGPGVAGATLRWRF